MNLFDRIPTRKPRTKKGMIEFLASHFRYHTLRSWNRMTSYAHNVKIYNLPWKSKDAESKAYDLISTAQAARVVQEHFDEFNRQTDYRYSIIARCLVPECDGVICTTQSIKESLWDNFYTAAPQRLRHFAEQYKIVRKA